MDSQSHEKRFEAISNLIDEKGYDIVCIVSKID